ncbi:MAG: DNA repair protein RadA [Candidatus Omnitrophica bacterium]|nr:DNA repair protein RadA [Candidatus Omnitrophota bacterium]
MRHAIIMFYCSTCGYKSVKWLGKCPLCEGWETFTEEKEEPQDGQIIKEKNAPRLVKDIEGKDYNRIVTGIDEFDRIIGGGLVKGEIILIGGEPGVGKSTLLLEISSALAAKEKTLYVSAEESPHQVSLRANRLNARGDNLYILGEDNLETVFGYIKELRFKFIVIDSIQVVWNSRSEGSKGSVSQLKGCADYLTQIAKSLNVVIFVVGHVTKEGVIAGPKLLEHIVDCVLYFEGEILSNYRILRAVKNRFGPTGDIAVFEMLSSGLKEVKKTTDLFLPHKDEAVSGSSVVCVIEGLRPLLIELQSLVSKASFGVVRRRSLGFDFNRFSLLIAIIEKRLKMSLSSEDVFLNVAGGLKINDPAADLGAVIAIISSYKEKEPPLNSAFIAEVGLAGELRRVSNINLRLKEIERAGFVRCFIPESNLKEVDAKFKFKVEGFSSLKEVIEKIWR